MMALDRQQVHDFVLHLLLALALAGRLRLR